MTILTDAFFDSMDSSVLEVGEAESLPPECYTSPEFYAFEKEALFNHEWLCVGRTAWLARPGDYFTTMHAGEPIVVTMSRDGAIHAMSSVCQHRGMLVAEGSGNARGLVCPYHHWTYGLDGRLMGAPAMEKTCNFEGRKISLPKFRVEDWQGFLFVNLDKDAPPLGPRLKVLSDAMANYEVPTLEGPRPNAPTRYPFNWKVMLENNNDGYHANKLHAGPLHDFIPSELAEFPEFPSEAAGYMRFNRTLHRDVGFNAVQKAVLPILPGLTEAERNRVMFVNVPPTLSMVMMSDFVLYLILHPQSAETHAMSMGWLVKAGAMDEPLFNERMDMNMAGAMTITAQDQHVDEMVQIGLGSQYAPRGRYSWQEQAQQQLNVWLVQRYRKGWERMKASVDEPRPRVPA